MYTNSIGDYGEILVIRELKKLDRNNYTVINDITLMYDNYTTQIDHIVISRYGIFVIETKAITGKITTHPKTWKQSLKGKNVKIDNPYDQNNYHIEMLSMISGLPVEKFKNLVVFTDENVIIQDDYNFNVLTLDTLNREIMKSRYHLVTKTEQLSLVRSMKNALCSVKQHIYNVNKK